MRRNHALAALLLMITTSSVLGCLGPHERYASRTNADLHGYGNAPLGPARYGVFYTKFEWTPTDTAIAYLLYRAAELTLQGDCTHFRLDEMSEEDLRNVIGITPTTRSIREALGLWQPVPDHPGAKWDLDRFDLTHLRQWRDILVGAVSVQQVTEVESIGADWLDAREVSELLGSRIRWCKKKEWPECFDRGY